MDDNFLGIQQVLTNNNFSDNEVKFFLTLLKQGSANAKEIAESSGMDKSSAYKAAKQLQEKGLIANTGDNYDRKLFIEDLNNLKDIITKKKTEADIELQEIDTFISELPEFIKSSVNKSSVKVYQGENAVQRIYNERLLSSPPLIREVMSNATIGELIQQDETYWHEHIKQRIEQGTYLHMLIDENDTDNTFHRTSKEQYKEVRILPEDFHITSGVNIYNNKVAIHNTQSMHIIAVVIDDATITELMKNFFDFVWRRSKII